ncbi:MAG: hypothetical protein RL404_1632 [Pseudomonadota bacterium]|jgi:hypothetical protein
MKQQAEKIIKVTTQSLGMPKVARPLVRRPSYDNVQDLWRRHGWVPPTELGKNFRADLRTTASV